MGFYAPPLRVGASASLAPGYVAPPGQQADASLSDAGIFRYRPSSRYAVDATIHPGYTAPTHSACDVTLTRPLAEADVLRPAGLDVCAFGGHDVRLAQVFLAPVGFDGGELALPGIRNASERVLAGHPPPTGAELRPGYSPRRAARSLHSFAGTEITLRSDATPLSSTAVILSRRLDG